MIDMMFSNVSSTFILDSEVTFSKVRQFIDKGPLPRRCKEISGSSIKISDFCAVITCMATLVNSELLSNSR